MTSVNPNLSYLQYQAAALLLYQNVLQHPISQAFLDVLRSLQAGSAISALQAYGQWFHQLAAIGQSWRDHLITQILDDDNPFSRAASRQPWSAIAPTLQQAAQQDLHSLTLLAQYDTEQLGQWVQRACKIKTPPIPWTIATALPENPLTTASDWADAIAPLAAHYARQGVGIWARYHVFTWQQDEVRGIAHPDAIALTDLAGYDTQKAQLIENTEFLLAGQRALSVLLYGSRGAGKSSLVKAVANDYRDRGLKLIEVPLRHLVTLPDLVEQLRDRPQKFILFVDDLSFEADDAMFKALKVVLEGTVTAAAPNAVVYATSNRRHLVREFFADRPRPSDADEVHAWDTWQEKLSFSDRFGLTLTFEPANQDTYLAIVRHLAQQLALPIATSDLDCQAKQWATQHNGRSGRSARQFIDYLSAQLAS